MVSARWARSGGRLMVSRAGAVFDADGNIVDGRTDQLLRKLLEGFVAYVRAHPRKND